MTEPTKTPTGDTTQQGAEGSTSSQTTDTSTKEQVEQIRHDTRTEIGRYKKAMDDAVKAAEQAKRVADAAEKRVNRFMQEQEEAEMDAAKGDNDTLSRLQQRRREREREAELARLKEEVSDKDERLARAEAIVSESTKERKAREIATRLKVNLETLSRLAKYTDGTDEAIEELAKDLPQVTAETPTGKQPLQPVNTGGTTGAKTARQPTSEELHASSPQKTDAKVKSGEWIIPGWPV